MKKRLHRPVIFAVAKALSDTFNEGYYADKVIERTFKLNKKMGARDRSFIAETVYEMVRWWRRIHYCLNLKIKTTEYSESEFLTLIGAWLVIQGTEIDDLPIPFQSKMDADGLRQRWTDKSMPEADLFSLPDWYWNHGLEELGDQWPEILKFLNIRAPLYIRVNSLKSDVNEVKKAFEDIEAKVSKISEFTVLIDKKINVFRMELFRKGAFEVQDLSSQKVAPFLQVKPGDFVIDACAGAGGKTLHLAAIMKNKGKLLALDVHERKLGELKKRARRAGAHNVEARVIDSNKVVKRLHGKADRVLLDVPCSGSGVLRRNPDSKWKFKPENLNELQKTQQMILENYSKMVRPEGKLVYSTCSVFPSENQNQIQEFLDSHKGDWELEDQWSIWPSKQENSDGFFGARLRRKA